MAALLAALLCFAFAAAGYDALRGTGSAAAPWLLGVVVASGACSLLLLARWTVRRTTRPRRRP